MNKEQEPTLIKIVVVGDGSVGKTCLLLVYTTDKFPTDYVPTVFDNYTSLVNLNGRNINLSLWDTAGQETYDNLRKLSYGSADVFFIVFSVADNQSFENALDKWMNELNNEELAKVPKVFIGNKIDMRQESNMKHISKATAEAIIKNQKGCQYYECSALTQEGLKAAFDGGIQVALNYVDQQNIISESKIKQEINKSNQNNNPNNKNTCCQLL